MTLQEMSSLELMDLYWMYVDFPRFQIQNPQEWEAVRQEVARRGPSNGAC